MTGKITPDEVLKDMAATFQERTPFYANTHNEVGTVLKALFPNGIVARTETEMLKVHYVVMMANKLKRFTSSGLTHIDSIHDLGVFAAMLESVLQSDPQLPSAQQQTENRANTRFDRSERIADGPVQKGVQEWNKKWKQI